MEKRDRTTSRDGERRSRIPSYSDVGTEGTGLPVCCGSVSSAVPMTKPRKAWKTQAPGFPPFPGLLGNPAHSAGFPHSHNGDGGPTPFTKTGSQTNRFGDNYDAVTFFVEATRAELCS